MKTPKTVPPGLTIHPQTITAETVRQRTNQAPRKKTTSRTPPEKPDKAVLSALASVAEALNRQSAVFERLVTALENRAQSPAVPAPKPYDPRTFRESIFGPGGVNS